MRRVFAELRGPVQVHVYASSWTPLCLRSRRICLPVSQRFRRHLSLDTARAEGIVTSADDAPQQIHLFLVKEVGLDAAQAIPIPIGMRMHWYRRHMFPICVFGCLIWTGA